MKHKKKVSEYLLVIDYYEKKKEWVQHSKHITANKTEVERKLEDFWEERQEVRKFQIYENIDYENMQKKVQKIIKNAYKDNAPEAKNINYYLIPLKDEYVIKSIKFTKKSKNE